MRERENRRFWMNVLTSAVVAVIVFIVLSMIVPSAALAPSFVQADKQTVPSSPNGLSENYVLGVRDVEFNVINNRPEATITNPLTGEEWPELTIGEEFDIGEVSFMIEDINTDSGSVVLSPRGNSYGLTLLVNSPSNLEVLEGDRFISYAYPY